MNIRTGTFRAINLGRFPMLERSQNIAYISQQAHFELAPFQAEIIEAQYSLRGSPVPPSTSELCLCDPLVALSGRSLPFLHKHRNSSTSEPFRPNPRSCCLYHRLLSTVCQTSVFQAVYESAAVPSRSRRMRTSLLEARKLDKFQP